MDRILADYRSAPVSPKVRAALGFLEKLITSPDGVTADDARAAMAEGVSAEALERAVEVCAAFTIIVRVADTLDFAVGERAAFDSSAQQLLKHGYMLP